MIQLGNCLDLLKEIKSESIDCIITDPPYRVTSRGNCGTMGGFWHKDIAKQGKIFENNDISPREYLSEFYRVLKNSTHCYIMINNLNLQEVLNEATKIGFHFVKSLIWDKQSKICGRYYMGCYEYILMFRRGGERPINNCSTPDILSIPISKLKDEYGNNLHDTEKPVELMKILVENSTNKGDIVLDSFMGIGTTGVACKQLNREFIGFEIDEKYFNIAKKRIDNESSYVSKKVELF